ncbi:30S ribosomal protein S3 [Candidatus Acetothermia bacterium]|nr:30S ribosomal protein S3 [Candidatus Acetothermia bacterium]MBI3642873.1 30S ribosomal protein S3 [Candidatus Acetothermia bacterium]
MGQKINPLGFRLGITQKWKSNWFNEKLAQDYLQEDRKVRQWIRDRYRGAGIADVLIERPAEDRLSVVIRTARPGIIIGKGGQEIDEFQKELESRTKRSVKISIKEVDAPDLEGTLVAEEIAYRLENRFPVQRAIKEVSQRVMERGAKGIKIRCSGRLGGAEIARSIEVKLGRVPLQTIRADIDYGFREAWTKTGHIGIKVWIFRGEFLPMRASEKRGDGHVPSVS